MFTATLTIQDLDFPSPDDAARHLLEVAGFARPLFVEVHHQHEGTRCIVEVAEVPAIDPVGAAAPDMLAALKEARRMVGAYVLALERGGNETDATHARYVERQIAETIAKAEGASCPSES